MGPYCLEKTGMMPMGIPEDYFPIQLDVGVIAAVDDLGNNITNDNEVVNEVGV